jgi:WD40 repeat protein
VSAMPEGPYKGLAAFEDSELDALLFFGRSRECEAVVANVLANRLTVLYGPSGVGKSSLLRAGVARRLRTDSGAPVVVHDSWVEDPAGGLAASVRTECGDLGPTAGLVDTVAAAAQVSGELHLLLDQFEEYLLYHGVDGPLSSELPELLRRPGLRVNVLVALRDDALSELDEFTGRIPDLFANLFRLDRLDRGAGRAAILGPLERYGELAGERFTAEDTLVDAVLDEVSEGRVEPAALPETATGRARIEAPYLQLVLERLWEREHEQGSHELRLATFREIGGARAVVREHVQGALERLSLPEQEAAARVVRQLVTPSGRKLSHSAADLAEYAGVDPAELRDLLERFGRERIVRGVNGTPGAPTRYEIFHDVLGPPMLAWQAEQRLRQERVAAARRHRRLLAVIAAVGAALLVVAGVAVFAFVQRSDAQMQARHAHGREIAARALAEIPVDPTTSVRLALRAAALSPGPVPENVLRSSLIAMREKRIVSLGGNIVFAQFAPSGEKLLVASNDGRLGLFTPGGQRIAVLAHQPALTTAAWSADGSMFATGTSRGSASLWRVGDHAPFRTVSTTAPVVALAFARKTLLVASGTHVRLVGVAGGRRTKTLAFRGAVVAAALSPDGSRLAVATRKGHTTVAELLAARSGRRIAELHDTGIHSFVFSPDGRLLASGSTDFTARLWNARTGRLLHVLQHRGYVLGESFSQDGRSLVTSSFDGAAYVWNVATGRRELLLVGALGSAEAAAFRPSADEIVVGFADRIARVYNGQDGRLLAPLAGHGNVVTSVGFDPGGRTIVTGSADGTARLWFALPAGRLRTIESRPTPVQTLFAGTKPVTVSGRSVNILSSWGRVLASAKTPTPIVAAAARPGVAAVADRRGNVYLLPTHGRRRELIGRQVTALAYESDGTLLRGAADGTVDAVGRPMRAVDGATPVLGLAAGGGRFLVRTATQVRVYEDDGTLVRTIRTVAQHAALAPDGQTLATTHGLDAQLWDAATGKLLHTLTGHGSLLTDAEFSPDGGTLVTASDDHTARTWTVATGRLRHVLRGHFFPVRTAAYSPDGRWIVTASQFNAGLWNARTGALLFYLTGNKKRLTGASFSPSGWWILTGSQDGTARIFHCGVCEPLPGLERIGEARLAQLR